MHPGAYVQRLLAFAALALVETGCSELLGVDSWAATSSSAGGQGGRGVDAAGGGGPGGEGGHGGDAPAHPLGQAIHWISSCASTSDMNSDGVDFGGGEPFTLEFWFRPEAMDTYQFVLSKGGTSTDYPGWEVHVNGEDLVLTTTDEVAYGSTVATALKPNHAMHVVVTRDGSEGQIWVLDRDVLETKHSLLTTSGDTPLMWNDVQRLTMGSTSYDPTSCANGFLKGWVDEVRLWGVKRTSVAFDSDYDREIPCETPGLEAYWRLNDGSGEVLADCSPNALSLAINTGVESTDYSWVDSPFDD